MSVLVGLPVLCVGLGAAVPGLAGRGAGVPVLGALGAGVPGLSLARADGPGTGGAGEDRVGEGRGVRGVGASPSSSGAGRFGSGASPSDAGTGRFGSGAGPSGVGAALDTVVVVGPLRLEASGRPQHHVERFGAEAIPGVRYTLVLAADGAPPSRAEVLLNGAALFTEAEYAAEVVRGAGRLVRRVALTAENTLEVTVQGEPGRALLLSVIREPDPTFVVFGPETYVRQAGAPDRAIKRFTLPATAAPPYALHVRSGAQGGAPASGAPGASGGAAHGAAGGATDGAGRVSSAVLRLNGRTVAGPSDFNARATGFTRGVDLLADNTLEVELRGEPGGTLTLWLTATDTAAPRLELTSPAEGQVTNRTELEVAGTVEDETAVRLEVNGTVAALTDGAFSHTVVLASEGENAITVAATDAAGNRTEVVRTVIRDTEPPVVSWTTPSDGLVTREDAVQVQGTATDRTEVAVSVNALPLVVEAGGAFSGEVALAEGENVLALVATDAAGNQTSLVRQVVRDSEPPVLEVTVPEEGAVVEGESVTVAGTVQDRTALTLTVNGQALEVAADGTFSGTALLAAEQTTLTFTATDAAGNVSTVVRTVERELLDLPPDPADVAPPIDPTVATNIATATAFLYTGDDPIQTGVAPGTIEPVRAAVVRGRVVTREGEPLPGVTVTVHGHPEYGQTLSRRDGWYDLAVNGGGPLTLHFEREGYLPAQRPVDVPWQDYRIAEDVALVKLDTVVTAIDLAGATEVQVARGSVVEDEDGVRQATLFFEPGTEAVMVLPDGTEQPLTTLHVRATEYTVGEGGPAAMPAMLPPPVGYTYAVELSVDEALAAGARSVVFSRPVAFYVENFLGFPVGENVPVGIYDFDRATWVPEDNGRVVQVVGVSADGLAELDVDGSGAPADAATLAALGISDGERARVAALYTVGSTLWRLTLSHFSTMDSNWVVGPWPGAEPPGEDPARPNGPEPCEGKTRGSIIGCESQSLGEAVGVVGTPFRLHYTTLRTPGNRAAYTLDIPLTGPSPHDSLRSVKLEVRVAGRARRLARVREPSGGERFSTMTNGEYVIGWVDPDFAATYAPDPNLRHQFTWDGKDAWGRTLQGRQPVNIRIGYTYPGYYYRAEAAPQAFGVASGFPISVSNARREATIWREYTVQIGPYDARALGLGGWSLDVHHYYDPQSQILYRGDGTQVAAKDLPHIITSVAGKGGHNGSNADGIPAREARLAGMQSIAVGPDGSIYVDADNRIRRIDPNGIITTYAGSGRCCTGNLGDGGPATEGQISGSIAGLALGPDGSLYIADAGLNRVRRVSPDGIITTFAGTGVRGFSGDGGPATEATFNGVADVAVGPDGSVYIADMHNGRVRRVSPSGIITTVAGNGVLTHAGDGLPATEASLTRATSVAVAPDGTLYIGDYFAHRVRRVTPDGIMSTFAGTGVPFFTGAGRLATETGISPFDITLDHEGNLYVSLHDNQFRVVRIDTDGIVRVVAGNGNTPCSTGRWWDCSNGPVGDGGPATAAMLYLGQTVAIGPDGALYIADGHDAYRVRKVASSFPGVGLSEYAIPSADGRELYHFDGQGRHLRTLDALTGAVLYRFDYDAAGRLAAVTDAHGRITTIERDPDGRPVAIVAPFGQRTELVVDSAGWLVRIENPAGDTVAFDYTADGLLEQMATPRGHIYTFAYDSLGRLIRDDDPAGGFKELARTDSADAYTVTLTTALGRATRYSVEPLATGATRRGTVDPAGLATTRIIGTDGRTAITAPDGTTTTVVEGADPRLGMQAPITKSLTVRLPSGRTSTVTTTRRAELADVADLLSLIRQTDTVRVNGRAFVSSYDAATRRMTSVTPEGRASIALLDSVGRTVRDSVAGLLATSYVYDSHGFLVETAQGDRTTTFGYDALGRLAAVTDALGRTDSLFYDLAGRLTRQKLADGREIVYGYDEAGNLTSLTPPGRSAHVFTYTEVDQAESYTPPDVGVPTVTTYRYNLDRQLTHVLRPGGDSVVIAYDSAGRPSAVSFDRGLLTFGYSPATGKLETITAPGGNVLSYTYDGPLPLTETWSGEVSGSVGVAYDNDFRASSQTVNGQDTVAFAYDGDGLLIGAGALVVTRRPDNGLVSGTTLEALVSVRRYNAFGELDTLSAAWGESALFRAAYTRDDLGRITGLVETVQGETHALTFAYDGAGRLKEVTRDGVVVEAYQYDANGNRLRATYPSGTLVGTYDAQDRLLSYGGASYTYAPGGELETKVEGSDTTRYTYDQLGNLVRVALPDGRVVEYVIDGRSRRVGRKVDGTLTHGWLYQDQLNPVAELDASGNVVTRFVYGTRANVPDYMVRGGRTYRIVSDHLGSVRLVVDVETGAVVQRLDHDAFGRVVLDTNPGFQPFGFAGGLYDPATGLVRFGARDYDPQTGRWTSKDPIGFAGGDPNLYGYVLGDPVNLVDPTGLAGAFCGGGFGDCFKDCLARYPGLGLAVAGLAIATGVNLKFPRERRTGASRFTSIDRRLPAWMRPSMERGAKVVRGTVGRVKYVGRYGTIAAGIAGLSAGYIVGASGMCAVQCSGR